MIGSARKNKPRRRWLASEVVQTSAMDCGPAGLKCLLEGFGIPVAYGRLREACQTDVDGTSIDTIETVANDLGVRADQVMIPLEHIFSETVAMLPALIVVRNSDGATHFVVVWRRFGSWLQVMDPAVGRRWVHCQQFAGEIYRHEMSVPAADWREWAGSNDLVLPLSERLAKLGADDTAVAQLIARAQAEDGWCGFGALDASVRLVRSVVDAGGVRAGPDAARLVAALFHHTCNDAHDIFRLIPQHYWSVRPDPNSVDAGHQRLLMRGAVLLHVCGPASRSRGEHRHCAANSRPLSPELAAALSEKPLHPLRAIWGLLKSDGILGPLALAAAMTIATAAVVIEAFLLRGIFDIGSLFNLASQRLGAVLGLLTFMAIVLAFGVPIVAESLRFGRHLDLRLRMALLRKLPHLTDRYFQSRPVSDMADRSHSIHLARTIPGMGINFVQRLCELAVTLIGIALIDRVSALFALAIAAVAIAVPAAFQPMINERDLRVRSHFGAMNGSYLDALLGLVPIRTHGAEAAVRHQHESLLVEWVRSNRRLIRASICTDGLQALLCLGLASALLAEHFLRARGVTGADLLLVYWTLKLPDIGNNLTALAHQYPMQRNVLLRLLEPLSAPERVSLPSFAQSPAPERHAIVSPVYRQASTDVVLRNGMRCNHAVSIDIENGTVIAAGHTILQNINLSIAGGEHVAIVGLSGAGKSSLVGVLLGWHRLAAGRLMIGGTTATDDTLDALRRDVAWIDPAVQIWNRSVLDNLHYSCEEPDIARSVSAIDAADLRGVLQKLPEGLRTCLGEGGALLSGGEGQRMRLARALAQSNVRLALLDEPFRGLDREQRGRLLAATRRHWQGATLLCVTHDVNETLSFDRVIVIEDGGIIEDGEPERLAMMPSRYRDLLDAERHVRDGMWAGRQWRRIQVGGGVVETVDAPALRPHAPRQIAGRA